MALRPFCFLEYRGAFHSVCFCEDAAGGQSNLFRIDLRAVLKKSVEIASTSSS